MLNLLVYSLNVDMEHSQVVFVIGGPGSGKGTVCSRLARESADTVHISIGDIMRKESKDPSSPLYAFLQTSLRDGRLSPDDVTVKLLRDAMNVEIASRPQGSRLLFLIDGFPRTVEQGKMFEEVVCPSRLVLHLDAPADVMTARILSRAESQRRRGEEVRSDDNLESLSKRFETHRSLCGPVVEYYKGLRKLCTLNATMSREMVYKGAVDVLDSLDAKNLYT